MTVAKRRKPRKALGQTKYRSTLPSASMVSSIPNEKPPRWFFKRDRSSAANGSAELNSSAFFFALLIAILVVFLAFAFLGAYYFSQRNTNDRKSHSSLRNNSLLLTNQAARYRTNQNTNATLNNNANRQSACTSVNSLMECQARPDCTVEYTCECDTIRMQADKCDYETTPGEDCICVQSGFDRCIELVCPIDR